MKTKGPWKIVSSKIVYKNPWMTVQEDEVIRPDGNPGIYGVAKLLPGVSILPITDDGYVYISEEYRYGIEQNSIEAMSGGIDENETPLQAAKRELHEESGIIADNWTELSMVNPMTSIINSPQYLFVAKGLKFGATNREGTEVMKIHKIKFADVYQMVLDGNITHAPTCVLILMANNLNNDDICMK